MNIVRGWMNPLACLRGIGLSLLAMGIFCPLTAMSQSVPPRFYWKHPVRRECSAADRDVHERQYEPVRPRAHRRAGR